MVSRRNKRRPIRGQGDDRIGRARVPLHERKAEGAGYFAGALVLGGLSGRIEDDHSVARADDDPVAGRQRIGLRGGARHSGGENIEQDQEAAERGHDPASHPPTGAVDRKVIKSGAAAHGPSS